MHMQDQILGWYGGAVVSTVTSQQEVSGFEPHGQPEPFCVELHTLPVPVRISFG